MKLSFGFGVRSYCVSLLLSRVHYRFLACNTYIVCFLCIRILIILYYNVIVLLLFVFVALMYCVSFVSDLYFIVLLSVILRYCHVFSYLMAFVVTLWGPFRINNAQNIQTNFVRELFTLLGILSIFCRKISLTYVPIYRKIQRIRIPYSK